MVSHRVPIRTLTILALTTLLLAISMLVIACGGGDAKLPPGRFAFLSPAGRPSVFDLQERKVVWEAPDGDCGQPAWSPDGKAMAYLARQKEPISATLVIYRFDSKTTISVGVPADKLVFLGESPDVPGEVDWAPSGQYLMVGGPGYPEGSTTFYDASDGKVVCETHGGGHRWSPEGDKVFLRQNRQDYKDPALERADLVVADLRTGSVSVIKEAAPGHWLGPAYWDKDRGLVYYDSTPDAKNPDPVRYFDLKGDERPQPPSPKNPLPKDFHLPKKTGDFTSEERVNAKTGDVLYVVGKDKALTVWIYLAKTKRSVELVPGWHIEWQP